MAIYPSRPLAALGATYEGGYPRPEAQTRTLRPRVYVRAQASPVAMAFYMLSTLMGAGAIYLSVKRQKRLRVGAVLGGVLAPWIALPYQLAMRTRGEE